MAVCPSQTLCLHFLFFSVPAHFFLPTLLSTVLRFMYKETLHIEGAFLLLPPCAVCSALVVAHAQALDRSASVASVCGVTEKVQVYWFPSSVSFSLLELKRDEGAVRDHPEGCQSPSPPRTDALYRQTAPSR
mmetsp:Transcript_41915/g.82799  ORF Transcript_41915/g.82799 Transcript_41915/m.82799 type:complete len:132 (+) Transcript_41915:618-1013(+)